MRPEGSVPNQRSIDVFSSTCFLQIKVLDLPLLLLLSIDSNQLHLTVSPFQGFRVSNRFTTSQFLLRVSQFLLNLGFCPRVLDANFTKAIEDITFNKTLPLLVVSFQPVSTCSARHLHFAYWSTYLNTKFGEETISLVMAADDTRTALLIIDMQNDFVLADGSMRVDGGLAIVPNVIKAVEVARRRGFLVVWVVREHDPLGRDVELFRRHLYADGKPKPTSKGSKGSELVDGLVIKEEDYKVVKTRFSAFFATNLHSVLLGAGINSLVVTGVQTPNCIRQTVFDAVALDYKSVTVIVDATAAATPHVHAANIYDMKNIGVLAPTLEEWCQS